MNCKQCSKQYTCNKEKCKPLEWHKTKRLWNTRKEGKMEQWLRDALAEEQGYIICPLRCETYTICDENCEKCEDYIDFKKALEERERSDNNGI